MGETSPEIMFGVPRSPHWSKVRDEYLASHPKCECCGGTTKLNVHHVKPFHVFPALELEPSNLVTLCEGSKGLNCHLWLGHCGNWSSWNAAVRKIAKSFGWALAHRDGIPWKAVGCGELTQISTIDVVSCLPTSIYGT